MLEVMWASLKKEIREVLRDKRTLLLTILVPLGFYPAMSLMTKDLEQKQTAKMSERVVNVAVSGWGDDKAVRGFNYLDPKVNWVVAQVEDRQALLGAGEVDVFVEAEQEEVEGYVQRKVTLHYFSTTNGAMAYMNFRKRFAEITAMEVVKRMEGKEFLLQPIEVVDEKDYATAREISGSKFGGMGAYFIVFLAFTGCMAVAVDTAAGEKERGTLEAMLVTPASFMGVAFGKLVFIIIMGMISVLSTIGGIVIMVVGADGDTGFSIGEVGFTSLLGISILLLSLVLFFASILFAFSILAKSNKEAHVRSSMLMIVVAMSLVYCIIPGVELTRTILWIPILNAAMSIKVLWGGGMPLGDYFLVLAILLVLSALVLLWISRKVNNDREKVLLKQ
ncbi:MAG: ABC transporter permease subunit [Akkermansiaceae bacterium]